MDIGDFLNQLKGVKPQNDGRVALCPAHDDHKQSLSVSEGDDGRILVKCFAGCDAESIVGALGLKLSDLFAEERSNGRIIEATYDYRDESGNLLFQAIRFTPKDFRQRRPDSAGGWINDLKGVRRVLYRLPELLAADPNEMVFLVEGEKDVDRLRAGGLVATCSPMGALKWRDEYADFLAGRKVVIIPDNDDPGRAHSQAEAISLQGKAASVKMLRLSGLPEKGDVSDWLSLGGTIETLRAMAEAEAAPEWTADDGDDDAPLYSGFYQSLQELHSKQTEPADYVLTGVRRRQVTLFLSVTNVGKSTTLLNHCLAAAAAKAWRPLLPEAPERALKVIYFDGESTDDELKQDTLTMLREIGGKTEALINFIPVVEASIKGEALDLSNKVHLEFVKKYIAEQQPDIVVIDTIGSLFTLFNENDNAEVKRKVIRPLKALAAAGNCGVIASHHIGKRGENTTDEEEAYLGRGASAFGSDTRAVFTLKREKSLGDGYVRLTLGKAKGVKFDPVNLKLDFEKRTFTILHEAPKTETPYQKVIAIFNGQPLRMKEIKEKLAKILSGRTVEDALKDALKVGDLFQPSRGLYQKPSKKPDSTSSTSPIGNVERVESTQPVENEEFDFNSLDWPENGECGNDDGDFPASEAEILEAIDQ